MAASLAYGLDPLMGLDDLRKPLRSKLLANDKLRQRYLQYVRQIASESLQWKKIGEEIAQTRELIQESVAGDTRKLMSTEAFLQTTSPDVDQQQGTPTLRTFVEERSKYLLEHEAIMSLPSKAVLLAPSSTPHVMRVSLGKLPRQDSLLVVSEVMASNISTVQDPQGDYDDWIELHNRGDRKVDLGGLYLSDDSGHARKWQFPAGTSIPPDGYLLIWADEDSSATDGLHANFKLSKKGESVALVSDEGLLSVLSFDNLGDDASYGPLAGKLQGLKPTPGSANQTP
jgi:hypothetical protein